MNQPGKFILPAVIWTQIQSVPSLSAGSPLLTCPTQFLALVRPNADHTPGHITTITPIIQSIKQRFPPSSSVLLDVLGELLLLHQHPGRTFHRLLFRFTVVDLTFLISRYIVSK